ncbi:MAG TPA: carboxypeptidase regulatory-like domain-containing protein, partial [Gemmatimonadaceae bacterium]|nr:carboxypeptidase regulatory-like domain-containing protein [Gemmatimonadaceae bacterium]
MFKRSLVSIALFALTAAAAHAQALAGRVTDAATSQPIAGARISLVGTLQGTQSRSDGSYRLPISGGSQVVRVSYIGYSPIVDTVIVGGDGAQR